jgi:hypothetical protein
VFAPPLRVRSAAVRAARPRRSTVGQRPGTAPCCGRTVVVGELVVVGEEAVHSRQKRCHDRSRGMSGELSGVTGRLIGRDRASLRRFPLRQSPRHELGSVQQWAAALILPR